jgi:hypothetical protein
MFLLRNAPAGIRQLAADDLVDDPALSRICNAYLLKLGRRLPTSSGVEE